MTRRGFTAAIAGAAFSAGAEVPLQAVYGEQLPSTLRISRRIATGHRYFELRAYTGEADALAAVFARAGFTAHRLGGMRFLIPFDSLEQRSRAWDRFNSGAQWRAFAANVRLTGLTIYRQPGGRIFERSL
jgi:hypothetical protein